jgi:hypothetical protein
LAFTVALQVPTDLGKEAENQTLGLEQGQLKTIEALGANADAFEPILSTSR